MPDDITDLKIMSARITATLEGVTKMLERHEKSHDDHYRTTSKHGVQIADLKASRRTLKWIVGLFGASGLGALFKWGAQ